MENTFRHIEDGFLTPEECQGFINMAEQIGFEEAKIQDRKAGGEVMNKDVRDNDRVIYTNDNLAAQLWSLVKPFVPETVDEYTAVGLNERFRFYRYRDGQQFKAHLDGAFKRNEDEHSKITMLIYLNEDFEGGATMFVNPYQVVEPKTGRLLLFAHKQLHTGSVVPEGTKYVLRTDVMYRKESTATVSSDEIYIGDMNEIFAGMDEIQRRAKLTEIATEWGPKGYMIGTGKFSENKAHEMWAIKRDTPTSEQ